MSMRHFRLVLLLVPLVIFAEGTARADAPDVSFGPGLRPFVHTDRLGRTLVDVCPERSSGGRRCFSQRVLSQGEPVPVPASGGSSCTAMGMCTSGCDTPPNGALAPTDILTAYDIPSTASAGGAIVAVVDLPSVNAMTDVNTYRTQFGIPTLPACPVNASGVPTPGGIPCFARVGTDGTVNTVSTTDCPGWAGETALDVEMISAACPDCSIVVMEAASAYGTSLDQMDPLAASMVLASAVSNSWGAPETGSDDDTFYESPGILTLAASGDDGYLMEDVDADAPGFPASSPYVLAVGGTTLQKTGSVYSESVWDDDAFHAGAGSTSSGCSLEFPMPSYQSASGFDFGPCKLRASVDVSAAAEFYGDGGAGIAAYVTDAGGWGTYVGTSAASPMVAAILVRLGLAGKDNHTLFYQNGGAFNDITSGNDDSVGICGGTVMCTAGKEWDGPTGLGSPNGMRLLALAGGTLEPEPDAGPTPPDGGPPLDAESDAGRADSGHDAGSHPSPPHGLGALCMDAGQCASGSQCVAPSQGKPPVCATYCDEENPCPPNYECSLQGFCFAGAPKPDAGGGDKDQPVGDSGCACSATGSPPSWSAAGWLALGVLAATRRRRVRRQQ
jgi:MYXO-CTERM domain-containing protein